MNKPWKLVLLLLGIYIAGGATGALVMARIGREMGLRRPGPEQWAPMQLKRLAERLDLSPEQKEQLQPIVRRNMDELRKLRVSALTETKAVFERMEREIADRLTPEQRAEFEQMNKEFRERVKRFMQDRPNRPPGGPGGPHFERERPPGDRPPPEKPSGT